MYRVKLQENEKLLEQANQDARKNGKKAEDCMKQLEYVKTEAQKHIKTALEYG